MDESPAESRGSRPMVLLVTTEPRGGLALDHVGQELRTLLGDEAVREVSGEQDALGLADAHQPALVLINGQRPDPLHRLVAELRAMLPPASRLAVIADQLAPADALALIQAGACGCLLADDLRP